MMTTCWGMTPRTRVGREAVLHRAVAETQVVQIPVGMREAKGPLVEAMGAALLRVQEERAAAPILSLSSC